MNRDYLADAESLAEHLDDNTRTLLGVGQQLRRIADALEAANARPLVVQYGEGHAIDMATVTDFEDFSKRLAFVAKLRA